MSHESGYHLKNRESFCRHPNHSHTFQRSKQYTAQNPLLQIPQEPKKIKKKLKKTHTHRFQSNKSQCRPIQGGLCNLAPLHALPPFPLCNSFFISSSFSLPKPKSLQKISFSFFLSSSYSHYCYLLSSNSNSSSTKLIN